MKANSFYISTGFSVGNYTGFFVGANHIYKGKISFHFNYSTQNKASHTRPDNYSSLFYGFDNLKSKELSVGYIKKTNKNKNNLLNLKICMTHSVFKTPVNWVIYPSTSFFQSTKYTYTNMYQNAFGIILSPELMKTHSKGLGISFTPIWYINKLSQSYGFRINLLLGEF